MSPLGLLHELVVILTLMTCRLSCPALPLPSPCPESVPSFFLGCWKKRIEERLFVLDDTDLGGAEDAAVELEALLLDVEDGVVLLVGHGGHEGGLVLVGVEDLTLGVDALETVLLEGLEEDVLGHLEALVEVDKVLEVLGLLLGLELLLGNDAQGTVEVIDRFNEVLGELLDGEVLGLLDLAGGALLEVAEVGDGAEALILKRGNTPCKRQVHHICVYAFCSSKTNLPLAGLSVLGLKLLLEGSNDVVLTLLLLGTLIGLLLALSLGAVPPGGGAQLGSSCPGSLHLEDLGSDGALGGDAGTGDEGSGRAGKGCS